MPPSQKINDVQVMKLYSMDYTTDEIAGMTGFTRGGVNKALRRNGIFPSRNRPTYADRWKTLASRNEAFCAREVENFKARTVIAEIRVSERIASMERALAQVVDRTPCIMCGVRADIGCRHSH